MNILVSIDDTDDLERSTSTGELAKTVTAIIKDHGWGTCRPITRHQLLIHPDIPYTSHNSSMCFAADLADQYLAPFIEETETILAGQSAPGSDPGLCVAVVERLTDPELLIEFGRKAQKQVLTKQEAYDLAAKLPAHLSEHGGTGQGVIGALAGAGLRLSGNDGRFQGKLKITPAADGTAKVGDILAQTPADLVRSLEGQVLTANDRVVVDDGLKLVLRANKAILLVSRPEQAADGEQGLWRVCTKQQLKDY